MFLNSDELSENVVNNYGLDMKCWKAGVTR